MNKKNCNSCSQGGSYFNFGKSKKNDKMYALINGKYRRIYLNTKGKYYNLKNKKKYISNRIKIITNSFLNDKKLKQVKNKHKIVGYRLSARDVFNKKGLKSVGKSFKVLQKDGKYKVKYLRLRKNGTPYFSTKFGNTNLNLKLPYNKNWLRGDLSNEMTGLKYSWPTNNYNIPPSGVSQPYKTSILPHMHFGKMCFGA